MQWASVWIMGNNNNNTVDTNNDNNMDWQWKARDSATQGGMRALEWLVQMRKILSPLPLLRRRTGLQPTATLLAGEKETFWEIIFHSAGVRALHWW